MSFVVSSFVVTQSCKGLRYNWTHTVDFLAAVLAQIWFINTMYCIALNKFFLGERKRGEQQECSLGEYTWTPLLESLPWLSGDMRLRCILRKHFLFVGGNMRVPKCTRIETVIL